jgi:hypothetical protein
MPKVLPGLRPSDQTRTIRHPGLPLWAAMLAEAPPLMEGPTERERPTGMTPSGDVSQPVSALGEEPGSN